MEDCGFSAFVFCHGDVSCGRVLLSEHMEGWQHSALAPDPPIHPLLELIDVTEHHPPPPLAVRLLWAPFSALYNTDGLWGSFLHFLSQQDSAS